MDFTIENIEYFQVYILFIYCICKALLTKKSENIDENAEFPQKPCLIPAVCIY